MSKMNSILFGRRTWAIIVSLIMVFQMLPLATIADSTTGNAIAEDVVEVDRQGNDIVVDEVGMESGGWKPGRDDDGKEPGGLIGDLPTDPLASEQPSEPENPGEPENPVEPENPGESADPEVAPETPGISIYFPVVFVDKDGKILVRKSVLAGDVIGELPLAPAVEGRTFVGWFAENGLQVSATTKVNGMMRISPKYDGDVIPSEELPAQTFSATTAKDVSIKASVPEGVFPAGTTMKVTDIDPDKTRALALTVVSESAYRDAVAVDISFYDAKGMKIEPMNAGKVRVEMRAGRKLEGDTITLYHETSKDVLSLMGNATPYGVDFESSAFSVYIVIGTGGEEEYARIYTSSLLRYDSVCFDPLSICVNPSGI